MQGEHSEMKLPLDLFKIPALNVFFEEAAEFFVGLIHTSSKLELFYQIESY